MIDKSLKTIADHFRYANQKSKTIEETGEFLQALEKFDNNPIWENIEHLSEEIADLEICLEQLKYLLVIDYIVDNFRKEKIHRTLERIASEYYKK